MKCLQELKRNSTDKEHLHTRNDFLREQVQINTGATEGLHSKPEVQTKAKRSLKAITYVDQTKQTRHYGKKEKRQGWQGEENCYKKTVWSCSLAMSPAPNKDRRAVLNFEGKRYNLNDMTDELKRLVRGLQTAESQLKHAQDQLRVVAVGRQVLASQLKRKLTEVSPCED